MPKMIQPLNATDSTEMKAFGVIPHHWNTEALSKILGILKMAMKVIMHPKRAARLDAH